MAEWRPVPGWAGLYEVSDDGRIRSLPKKQVRFSRGVRQEVMWAGRELKPALCNGYPRVELKDVRSEKVYVHRVVCTVFHGAGPKGHEVAHCDGSRTNNAASNLRWASRTENVRDKALHGTQPQGEEIHNSKLTEAVVGKIRLSADTARQWAERLGVDPSTISDVRRMKTWRHVGASA